MKELPVVALGAVLHDIGKVIQRADSEPMRLSHSVFGAQALEKAGLIAKNQYWHWVLESIQNHHWKYIKDGNVTLPIAWFVYEADNLASAHDRKKAAGLFDPDGNRVEETDSAEKASWDRYRRLDSVFSLFRKLPGAPEGPVTLPLWYRRISDDIYTRDIYPYPGDSDGDSAQVCYQILRDQVIPRLLDYLKGQDPTDVQTVNTVIHYLEEALSMIPPDTFTQNTNDVSLFDHLKLTAAIATSMYAYVADQHPSWLTGDPKRIPWTRDFRNEPAYLLVKADLSGIQEFIYNVSSKAALKGLRGRSFHLELVQTVLAEQLLSSLGLSLANLLYQGGGGFAIIAPNTQTARTTVEKVRQNFNAWLLKRHRGRLFLALELAPFSGQQIVGDPSNDAKTMRPVWNEVGQKLADAKAERFRENLRDIFTPYEHVAECHICHRDDTRLVQQSKVPSLAGWDVCPTCDELVYLGGRLPDAAFKESGRSVTELSIVKADDGSIPRFDTTDLAVANGALEFKSNSCEGSFILHNRDPFRRPKLYWSLHEYGDNEFTTLAEASKGVKRIGVLRADVDNLGKVFSGLDPAVGIPTALRSLSRDAAISRSLARFFTHYLDDMLRYSLEGNSGWAITTVYAGGDDVFLVGAWDQIVQFALELQLNFARYTCNRLTVSAGISIHKPKYPLYKMAEDAGEAESVAKRSGKNRLCVRFDDLILTRAPAHCFTWKEWRDLIVPLVTQLDVLAAEAGVSSKFLNELLAFTRIPLKDRSFYRLLYKIARFEERSPEALSSKAWQEFKTKWLMPLGTTRQPTTENGILQTALNWHLLLMREESSERKRELAAVK